MLYRRLTPKVVARTGTHVPPGRLDLGRDQRVLVVPNEKRRRRWSRTRFGREGSRRASAIGRVMATNDKTSLETADNGARSSFTTSASTRVLALVVKELLAKV
jgi:hypothetical protein